DVLGLKRGPECGRFKEGTIGHEHCKDERNVESADQAEGRIETGVRAGGRHFFGPRGPQPKPSFSNRSRDSAERMYSINFAANSCLVLPLAMAIGCSGAAHGTPVTGIA